MFAFCGYNFCADKNALDSTPREAKEVRRAALSHGILDHWHMTRDVASAYSSNIPTVWDIMTVMDANFNGNLNAGNVDFSLSSLDGFNIKRRKVGEFDWVNLAYIPVSEIGGLDIAYNDNLAQSGVEYEYALVPVAGGVEGNYLSNTVGAEFDGVFICDADTVYRFYAGVEYGASEKVQKIGVFEPYGRKYPVVVSNGALNYEQGSFSGTVLAPGYLEHGKLDRLEMVKERKVLLDFLTNKRAKILKDWNGNIWLCCIVGNPSIDYNQASGMGIANVGASYVEIGDANNQTDLYNAGLVSEVQ